MDLVVEDASESLSRATEAVKSRGGYVAETRQWSESNRLRASATLRVPANMLEAAIADIRKEATRINHEGITGQDVSEEFADLGAQLTNLRSTETELRQLLTTVRERTQKASDVLEVYQELSKVRGNIERLQGRVEYLKQMTAMSTINLALTPDELSEPIIEPGWNPIAISRTAVRALFATLKVLGAASIWVVVFLLPLSAVIAGLVFLFWKLGKSFLRSR
jgi:hypothetical protein